MQRINKNDVIQSAINAQEANKESIIVANLVIIKSIEFTSAEQFEETLRSLKGDKITECQIEVKAKE